MTDNDSNPPPSHPSREGQEENLYLQAILRTMRHPLLVLDGSLTVERPNRAFLDAFQVEEAETVGTKIYDLGNGQWNIPKLRDLLERILPADDEVSDFPVEHEFETIGRRMMLLNAYRMRRDGQEDRILLSIEDVTEKEKARWELEGQREYAEKIVDASRDALLILNWDLRVNTANQTFYETFKVDPSDTEHKLIYELGNGQWDIPGLRKLLENVLPKNSTFDDFEVEHEFDTIGHRIMVLNARRIDHMQLILLAIEDKTGRRAMEEHQKVLISELQHRTMNLMGVVQSIADKTACSSTNLEDFRSRFSDRLQALARVQRLLSRLDDHDRVNFDELIDAELSAWSDGSERITFDGPAGVALRSSSVQTLAMALHELATNAIKYGALSQAEGRLTITWTFEPPEERGEPWLHIKWRESGVIMPPEGSVPQGTGQGRELIERALPYQFDAKTSYELGRDGICCTISIPVSKQTKETTG